MPGRDGTGPAGSGGGGGIGRQARSGRSGGRKGGLASAGPEGFCVCPKCGTKVPHQRAQTCSSIKCPQCDSAMARE